MTRRKRFLILIAAAVALGAAGAYAWFSSIGTGTGSASTSQLNPPAITAATPGAGTVALNWSAVTAPGTGTVNYYVTRNGATPGGNCPTSSAPSTVTSCTDSGLSAGTYSYTVTAVWRTWTAMSSASSVTVGSGAFDHFLLTAATTSPTAGAGDSLTVTAKDAGNNTVTSYTGDQSLTFTGAGNAPDGTQPTVTDKRGTAINFGTAETITFSSGVATASSGSNGEMKLYKAETTTIVVSDGIHTNGSGLSVTVAAGTTAKFAVGNPGAQTAGTAFNVTLNALDTWRNPSAYSGAHTIAWSGPANAPDGTAPLYPSSATALTFNAGAATATGIKLFNAAPTTLTATEGSITGTSTSFTVNAAAPSVFQFTNCSVNGGATTNPCPASVSVGGNNGFVSVHATVLDTWHNVATVTGSALTVTLSNSNATRFSITGTPVVISVGTSESNAFTVTHNRNNAGDSTTISTTNSGFTQATLGVSG